MLRRTARLAGRALDALPRVLALSLAGTLVAVYAATAAYAGPVSIGAFPGLLAQALLVGGLPTTAPSDGQALTYQASTKRLVYATPSGGVTGIADGSGTANRVAYWTDSDSIGSMAAGTSGQPLLSQGASAPTFGTLGPTVGGTGLTSCTQGDILYASASNTWSKLAAGTSGQFLKTQGAGANPTWAAASSTPYMTLLPDRSVAPVSTTSFAALSSRNGHGIAAYDQSVNLEKRLWESTMPASYAGGTITAKVYWCSNGVTYGSVVWNGRFERIDSNSLDIDSDSFASAQTATGTAPTTDGAVQVTSITFTQSQADSIAAGEPFRFELARDGASASDTHLADAQVICVTLQE